MIGIPDTELQPDLPVRGLLARATSALHRASVINARLNAELLLAKVLGARRIDFVLEPERRLTGRELEEFETLVARRAARIPLQHLLGEVESVEANLLVRPGVFVPRPETERLIEDALGWLAERPAALRILDLGVGAGPIAVNVAMRFPAASITGTDLSWSALELTRDNLRRAGVEGNVRLLQGDLFDPLAAEGRRSGERPVFDAILSNPPYIATRQRFALQPEVRDHDPAEALFGGEDGLDVIRRIVAGAGRHLSPAGLLAFEIGADQGKRVLRLLEEEGGYRDVEIRKDLMGLDRYAWATYSGLSIAPREGGRWTAS